MTPAEIAGAVMFFIAVSGALWAIWNRIEGKLDAATKSASDKIAIASKEVSERATSALAMAALAREEVATHRLHVAETYITKEGLRHVKDEIMGALFDVKGSIDHLGGRIDSMYSQVGHVPPPRARKAT